MITPERDLEESLVAKLRDLKYEYRPDIRDRAALEANFREKFEALNRVTLTDGEFQRLLDEIVTPDVYEAARSLRNREAFTRADGTPLNYILVNIKDWCKNHFEVVNQLRINTDNSHHRYDVMLLINGVPVVQIELKTLGISPRRAMEQIVDYKNDPGNGYTKTLLCFGQLFIVSNRTDTWYFANNNARHFAFDADERFLPIYQFAAEDNSKITHLDDFAERFLAKCTLGQMISKYMVLIASEQKLLMMRPYQIYAVKAIVDCIDQNCGNGYIWHTTGSGKTLTSFKTSTLLKTNESIHKCLFVVDRKDLDHQTREEFNRFQENCVEQNTNTAALVRRLESDDYADKVIVTTIQKLGLALDENSKHNRQNTAQGRSTFKQRLEQLRDKRMVFIFDECHRSQFGENHRAIEEFFPNSQLFGFTGTPIFEDNATVKQIEGDVATLQTTKDLFQQELHAYTITHAIEDLNVLRFHVDYYKPTDAPAHVSGPTLTKQGGRSGHPRQSTMPRLEIDASTRCWPPPRSTTPSSTTRSSSSFRSNARPTAPSSSPSRSLRSSRPRGGQPGRSADPGGPPPGEGGQPARPRGQEDRAQGHHRRLQPAVWRELRHQQLRPLLPGRPAAHQGSAVPQPRPAPQGPRKDRHHHRRRHAPHRLRRRVPQHALRRQEPQAPRPEPGLLPHQPRPQRDQALRQHPRLPPAARQRRRRHRSLLRCAG